MDLINEIMRKSGVYCDLTINHDDTYKSFIGKSRSVPPSSFAMSSWCVFIEVSLKISAQIDGFIVDLKKTWVIYQT